MSVRREVRRHRATGAVYEYWVVDVQASKPEGGFERIRKVFSNKRAAFKFERTARAQLEASKRPEELEVHETEESEFEKVEVPTLGAFAEEFLATYVKNNNKPSEQAAKQSMIKHHIKPLLGDVPIDQVGRKIEWFKAQLLDRNCAGGQGTGNGRRKRMRKLGRKRINNILALLGKMLRYAADDLRLIDDVPKVRLLKLPRTEHDFLSFEEYDKLVEAARQEPQWYAAILAAGDAGLRQGEIIGLEWPDVDFEDRTLTVRRTVWKGIAGTPKGGCDRTVPMTERLHDALQGLPRHIKTVRVFHSPDGSELNNGKMQRPLWRCCRRAGIRRISWHTLRHTYCSHLGMLGAAPVAIQAAAGHQSLSTTRRYIHVAADVLRETIRRLDQRVASTNRDAIGDDPRQKNGKKPESAPGRNGKAPEESAVTWREHKGIEPSRRPVKDASGGFEGRGGHQYRTCSQKNAKLRGSCGMSTAAVPDQRGRE